MGKKSAVKSAQEKDTLESLASNEIARAEANSIQETKQPITPLKPEEKALLKKHEDTIEAGLNTFQEVGMAFADIRDRGLYREHGTFDEYCQNVWSVSRSKAYRYMAAAKCAKHLKCSQLATKEPLAIPTTEKQARKLAQLKPEQQLEVAKKVAQEKSDPTAKDFDEAVEAVNGEKKSMGKTDVIEAEVQEAADITPKAKPDPDLVPMSQIAETIKTIYNIYSNSSKKQEGLKIFGKLERWIEAWVDWEAKQKEVA